MAELCARDRGERTRARPALCAARTARSGRADLAVQCADGARLDQDRGGAGLRQYMRRQNVGEYAAGARPLRRIAAHGGRSEEHTSELQSLMRISYAVFCLKKKKKHTYTCNTLLRHTIYTEDSNENIIK